MQDELAASLGELLKHTSGHTSPSLGCMVKPSPHPSPRRPGTPRPHILLHAGGDYVGLFVQIKTKPVQGAHECCAPARPRSTPPCLKLLLARGLAQTFPGPAHAGGAFLPGSRRHGEGNQIFPEAGG
jgi:hypothetical protein